MRALILLLALANVAAAPHEAVERVRIQAERRALEAQYQQSEQACRENFQVTVCVDAAKAQRRSALASLREQQTRLDDEDRRRRAAARLQAIDQKRGAMAARPAASAPSAVFSSPASASASASASARAPARAPAPAPAPAPATVAATASASASASAPASDRPAVTAPLAASPTRRPAAGPPPANAGRRQAGDGGATAAAKRATAANARREQAEKERLKIAQRVAAAKKGVAPLPVPAASAPR